MEKNEYQEVRKAVILDNGNRDHHLTIILTSRMLRNPVKPVSRAAGRVSDGGGARRRQSGRTMTIHRRRLTETRFMPE
jgi:hypothetical protein